MTITTIEAHAVIFVTTASSLISSLVGLKQLRELRRKVNGHLAAHHDHTEK